MYKTHAKHKRHDELSKLKETLAQYTRDIKGRAGVIMARSLRNAKDKSDEIQDNVSHAVSKKPFKSLGVALLTGAVIGYFLHK